VAAPSLIARAPAERGRKRDAADAQLLARALRAGQLRPVRVPDPIDEAARDLVRACEDARADLMRARHRLPKLLLRHGRLYEAGRAWTGAHEAWLARQRLEHPGARAALADPCGPSWPLGCAVMASTPASRSSRPTRALPRWSGACRACAGSAR
jgi:transposase